jgi:hypothetical protein
MRIELSIGQLVAHGIGADSTDEFVAALTAELHVVLARELGQGQLTGGQAISVPRLRAKLTLPPAGSASAGRAIGAALGGAVTGDQVFRGGTKQ